MYHYKECGLKNVWLASGFETKKTPYGKRVSISDLPDLHRAIGMLLSEQTERLSGPEFRFLRKEMELTQEAMVPFLGVSAQQIALYERRKPTAMADLLMRFLYREHVSGNAKMRELIDRLVARDKDRHKQKKAQLTYRPDAGWQLRRA